MGVVYEAYDPQLNRRVALKVLPQDLTFDPQFVDRFLREGRLSASLAHPNVVTVYEAREVEGFYYLAMEFIEGSDLALLLRQKGPLDPELAMEILQQMAAGLDAAHAKGIVHRDIKPENCLLDIRGTAKLADFGIARAQDEAGATRTGVMIGTAEYMSPEQALGKPVDARSDVYALACVAFEMLTGAPPFGRTTHDRTAISLINDHAHRRAPSARSVSPQLRKGTDYALARALDKDPAQRYTSAGEFVNSLRHASAPLITRRAVLTTAATAGVGLAGVSTIVNLPKRWASRTGTPASLAPAVKLIAPDSIDPARLPAELEQAFRQALNKLSGPLTRADLQRIHDLRLYQLKLSDLTPLAALTSLEKLSIMDVPVMDLMPIAGLTSLQSLDLARTRVVDLAPLVGLTSLQTFTVHESAVSDPTPVVGLTTLRNLSFVATNIADLTPLAAMSWLPWLCCNKSKALKDLSPVAKLTSLTHLIVDGTGVSDLHPLAHLTAMQRLSVGNTDVSDLSPLSELTSLQDLDLESTFVSDLTPLRHLTSLDRLVLKETPVSDLSPLSSLTNLTVVDVEGSQVTAKGAQTLAHRLPKCAIPPYKFIEMEGE